MNNALNWATRLLPVCCLAGCTLVFAESDPEPEPRRTNTPDSGIMPEAGTTGEGGDGAVIPTAGSGGQGETGGTGGAPPAAGGAGGEAGSVAVGEGLGEVCAEESTCPETAPECPEEAGYCTFFCDEAWINGWQYDDSLVAECEAQGGTCTPIGEERSYCVP
jgi:hypothetical protein